MPSITQSSNYFRRAFEDPEGIVAEAQEALSRVDFDTMVGTGLSGALVIPILARAMDKYFMIVRKPNDGSHAWRDVEGTLGERWLFVDDFVESGGTLRRCQEVIRGTAGAACFRTTYVGTFAYERDSGFKAPGREGTCPLFTPMTYR